MKLLNEKKGGGGGGGGAHHSVKTESRVMVLCMSLDSAVYLYKISFMKMLIFRCSDKIYKENHTA